MIKSNRAFLFHVCVLYFVDHIEKNKFEVMTLVSQLIFLGFYRSNENNSSGLEVNLVSEYT